MVRSGSWESEYIDERSTQTKTSIHRCFGNLWIGENLVLVRQDWLQHIKTPCVTVFTRDHGCQRHSVLMKFCS